MRGGAADSASVTDNPSVNSSENRPEIPPAHRGLVDPRPVVRAETASLLAEAGDWQAQALLRELLADSAPFRFMHGSRGHVSEVRMRVLDALQTLYRSAARPPDFGTVLVRKGMADDVVESAVAELYAQSPPGSLNALAARAAREVARYQPADDDERQILEGYRLLQIANRIAYREEEVDPKTWLTPLQSEIAASQMTPDRPRPHLVVSAGSEDSERKADKEDSPVLGYCYRSADGKYCLDFASVPAAVEAEYFTRTFLFESEPGAMPRVCFDDDGRPLKNPDGSLVLDGSMPLDETDALEVLRSLAAFVEDPYLVRIET